MIDDLEKYIRLSRLLSDLSQTFGREQQEPSEIYQVHARGS